MRQTEGIGLEAGSPTLSRREVLAAGATLGGGIVAPSLSQPGDVESRVPIEITVNGAHHALSVDPRTTLLDLLRERLHLTGTKKGCDHGQCGACTVLVGGRRVLSCLTLVAVPRAAVVTIEGIGSAGALHPLQRAFVKHDGLQCGYCTPGQICSAVGMLEEIGRGVPSRVTDDLGTVAISDDEIRERMSGNLCRCAAYPNIVAAIRDVSEEASA